MCDVFCEFNGFSVDRRGLPAPSLQPPATSHYNFGTIHGTTYAWSIATIPISVVRIRLWMITVARISPSRPTAPTPAAPTERFCGLIIFPITPAELLVAAINTGSSPDNLAVVACSGPNSVLDDVSLPVRKTPIIPSHAAKKGNSTPVFASASAMDDVMPE